MTIFHTAWRCAIRSRSFAACVTECFTTPRCGNESELVCIQTNPSMVYNDLVDGFVGRCDIEHDDLGKEHERKDVRDLHLLPYNLVAASEKMDIWMLGVLLYHLCSGEPLFPTDDHGNLRNGGCLLSCRHGIPRWPKVSSQKRLATRSPNTCCCR